MFEIGGIDHIVLRTTQLNEMLAFYKEVLGCKIERETSPEIGLTQLRAGDALIDLITVSSQLGKIGGGPPSKTENNLDHFCLQVKTTTEAIISAHLRKHGINATQFESRYGAEGMGNSTYLKDPDGNTVELRIRNY
ncbi:MAG: glyoxylase I family protein [Candidatus Azotimanducaceae bacterium]|jgi:glyoxylase I family protein